MNLAHEKILEALKNSDEPLTQYDLADITGYSPNGIRARVSELCNFFGYKIESVKMSDGGIGYFLPDEGAKVEPENIALTQRRVKETKMAIYKYKRMLDDIRDEVKHKPENTVRYKPHNESLVILNSDFHIGKKVVDENSGEVTYNSEIAVNRLNKLMGKNLKKLIEHILSSSTLDEIVILNIGDYKRSQNTYAALCTTTNRNGKCI